MKGLISILIAIFTFFSPGYSQTFNLSDEKFEIGDKYIADPKILFDLGKATIRPESYDQIDSIAAFMGKHRHLVIEVGTHTDYVPPQSSTRLTHQRSESIVDYLISKGVAKERLVAKGYGETKPIASNTNADGTDNRQGRWMNRRTEFLILGTDYTDIHQISRRTKVVVFPLVDNQKILGQWQLGNNSDHPDTLIFIKQDTISNPNSSRNPNHVLTIYENGEATVYKSFSNAKTTEDITAKSQPLTIEIIDGDTIYTSSEQPDLLYGCSLSPKTWNLSDDGKFLNLKGTNDAVEKYEIISLTNKELVVIKFD